MAAGAGRSWITATMGGSIAVCGLMGARRAPAVPGKTDMAVDVADVGSTMRPTGLPRTMAMRSVSVSARLASGEVHGLRTL